MYEKKISPVQLSQEFKCFYSLFEKIGMAEFLLLNPTIIPSQSIDNTNEKLFKFVQRKVYKKVIHLN